MTPSDIHQLITLGMPNALIEVTGADNVHFEARVVSESFIGKMPLARHRLVYACLGSKMGQEIHALSLKTLTPAEAAAQSAQ